MTRSVGCSPQSSVTPLPKRAFVFLVLRKARSAWLRLTMRVRSSYTRTIAIFFQEGICVAHDVRFGRGVVLSATDGGTIVIEEGVAIGSDTKLVARSGSIHIERDVFIGDGVVMTSMEQVQIGAGSQVAEYVVIRDQDHRIGMGPMRTSGFACTPIQIGRDCWIGAKATVLRGSSIGEGSVIGAHSLVRSDIPARCVAVGAPARVVRQIDDSANAEAPANS
jgi:acetyltransferase-like isoleucine patch superfamily enzyme